MNRTFNPNCGNYPKTYRIDETHTPPKPSQGTERQVAARSPRRGSPVGTPRYPRARAPPSGVLTCAIRLPPLGRGGARPAVRDTGGTPACRAVRGRYARRCGANRGGSARFVVGAVRRLGRLDILVQQRRPCFLFSSHRCHPTNERPVSIASSPVQPCGRAPRFFFFPSNAMTAPRPGSRVRRACGAASSTNVADVGSGAPPRAGALPCPNGISQGGPVLIMLTTPPSLAARPCAPRIR